MINLLLWIGKFGSLARTLITVVVVERGVGRCRKVEIRVIVWTVRWDEKGSGCREVAVSRGSTVCFGTSVRSVLEFYCSIVFRNFMD